MKYEWPTGQVYLSGCYIPTNEPVYITGCCSPTLADDGFETFKRELDGIRNIDKAEDKKRYKRKER